MYRATLVAWYAVVTFGPLSLVSSNLGWLNWHWIAFLSAVLGCQVAWMVALQAYLREHPEVKRKGWRRSLPHLLPFLVLFGGVMFLLSDPDLLLAIMTRLFGMLTLGQQEFAMRHPSVTAGFVVAVPFVFFLWLELRAPDV